MQSTRVGGVELSYELLGAGDPLVLVHGGLADHYSWQAVAPALAESFRVLVYDRRGHSRSERVPGPCPRRAHEDDLAALLETLGMAPAHAAGNSYGGSTILGLAARRPELFRGVVAHEPPLMGTVGDEDGELGELVGHAREGIAAAVELMRAGRVEEGTRHFLEDVALGPGAWAGIPDRVREAMLANAPTFVAEQLDRRWADLDTAALAAAYDGPLMLTYGTRSPAWLPALARRLAGSLPGARLKAYEGAGHIPQVTHPAEYVTRLTAFASS
ncbi:alpha/beta hydrolase [Streptomyces sp. NPDC000410]|uniref:alpha/beta fold hydrolase n=1 Tax=Streptomyces sp. NPDC000410 TaxID=3154254 RepID=UPI0033266E12